jgi:ABC-type transport system involved in multi-copper enzyme maturation permease subunit
LCSDRPLIVLTRRELGAFFYSPIAYMVIIGLTLVGWFMFASFVDQLARAGQVMEPIVARYILHFIPVICLIFVVPVVTMRLLSEEKRSGTLEVLLTAPVNEVSVVLSKFVAALIFYTIALAPWWLFLVALRVFGKQPFAYRPMLSFLIALT